MIIDYGFGASNLPFATTIESVNFGFCVCNRRFEDHKAALSHPFVVSLSDFYCLVLV